MTDIPATPDRIRLMSPDDLRQVLSWRNHPNIRRYMYSQHEIKLAEHQRWFEKSTQDPHKNLLIFEAEDNPMGFVQLSQLDGSPIVDWGFYTAPDARKGMGRRLGRAALRYAFQHLELHKICGQALAYNEPSISLHRALGFQQEGWLREQRFDGQYYHDVLCFGLLSSEWQPDH